MAGQVTLEVSTAADLARLLDEGNPLTTQELKELNARIKAFEEMARMEDRLRLLENRKRQRSTEDDYPSNSIERRTSHPSTLGNYSVVRSSLELEDSESSSSDTIM